MIRNISAWRAWEQQRMAAEKPDFHRNLRIYEMMYAEARLLGILPRENPLEGMEEKIQWVKKLHVSTTLSKTDPSA